MSVLLVNGDALKIPLADGSVHCCVTSPPYYSLRDYGISGQLGLEASLDEYIDNMVQVFREVWRVLRDDGTLWLNLGDSYAGSGGAGGDYNEGGLRAGQPRYEGTVSKSKRIERGSGRWGGGNAPPSGDLKPKDLMGVPWRVAFALQADGWYLRSDIIWAKPNPMPESVTDRPTKSHEYLFLLTKNARYYYDQDAIREPLADATLPRALRGVSETNKWAEGAPGSTAHTMSQPRPNIKHVNPDYAGGGSSFREGHSGYYSPDGRLLVNPAGRNKRTVWEIPTRSYSGAHFATFPPALVEPCIKAGTSERGVCPECGAPWKRVIETNYTPHWKGGYVGKKSEQGKGEKVSLMAGKPRLQRNDTTTGWQPTCTHDAPPIPAIILDPFAGSGTTVMVARQLGRHGVGLDLSFPYLHDQARERLQLTALEEWRHGLSDNGKDGANVDDLPLFATQEQQT